MEISRKIVDLAKQLIAFQTTEQKPHHLQNCVDFCVNFFQESKLIVKKYNQQGKPSVVILTHDTVQPDVLMVGHLDVVPADQQDFVPRVKDGKLYGRGAIDMKGQIAVMMQLMKELPRLRPDSSTGLLLTTDEEIGGQRGAGYLANEVGYGAKKIVLIPDGGDLDRLIIKQKGLIHFKIEASGKSAHGSRPWYGKNAIEMIMNCYQELKAMFPDPISEDDWMPSICIGKIVGGLTTNQVPESASALIDFRATEERSLDECSGIISAIVKKHGLVMTETASCNVCTVSEENQYFLYYRNVAEKILGRNVDTDIETGASDARFFSENGHVVIITKPEGDNVHDRNEWVAIESLHQFYQIIRAVLKNVQ